jgi:hypothetical protein
MKSFLVLSLVLGLGSLCVNVYAAPTTKPKAKGPEPLPATAEIRENFEKGDYAGTLKMLARVLPLKGAPAAGYDRYELLIIKGESQLQLKQVKSATDTFALAAASTKDPRDAGTARATARMLREAKDFRVQRRLASKQGPSTADILDPKQREAAMRIVYDDLRQTIEPKVKSARLARELPPIADAFNMLSELQDFELALTGVEDSQQPARDELGVRARDLIVKELDRMQKDTAKIYEVANEVVAERITDVSGRPVRDLQNTNDVNAVAYRRGISKSDRKELDAVIGTCRKIIPTLESLGRSTKSVTTEDVDNLVRRTKEVAENANRVMRERY